MVRVRRSSIRSLLLFGVAVAPSGCRDREAPPSHYRDVGEGDTVLLPVAAPRYDPRIQKGRAEWQPFRPLGAERSASAKGANKASSKLDNTEVESEIRELIDEYNGVVAERDIEGLLEFFVEDGQAALKPMLEAMLSVNEKLGRLGDQARKASPNAADRVGALMGTLGSLFSPAIHIKSIQIAGEGEASVTLASTEGERMLPPTVGVVFEQDYWYVAMPQADQFAAKLPIVKSVTAQLDSLLQDVESGRVSGEDVIEQLTAIVPSSKAAPDDGGSAARANSDRGSTETGGG